MSSGIPENCIYTDISDMWVDDISSCVELLKSYDKKGKKVKYSFNGVVLYSDTVTLDSAYKQITGRSKAEMDALIAEENEKYRREEREHREKIPALTDEWIEKGHKILDEKYWEKWDRCVPIRLDDLYHGMELGCCLEIVEALNNGCELSHALDLMEKQNHSGMSWGLVRSMIYSFCDRGQEFAERAV